MRELWSKNLVQINRLTMLEREAARLKGERAQSIAATAQSRGKISEIELQIIQIDQDLSSEVAKELREIDGKIGEFIERKVAAEDQLKRIDIRAPQDGVVHQLGVHTVGGVVSPAEPMMLIVPDADALVGRGQGLAAGHRPAPPRAAGRLALLRLQPAHHAGDQRHDQPHLGRRDLRPAHGPELLHGSGLNQPRRTDTAGHGKTSARYARGSLCEDL